MSRDDIKAAEAYCRENGVKRTLRAVMIRWSEQTSDQWLREFATEILQSAELEAKLSMIAPWYDGTPRTEQRLAAMLARKFGVSWWRDVDQLDERLGVIDDAWQAERIEPLIKAINEGDRTGAETPLALEPDDWPVLRAALELGADKHFVTAYQVMRKVDPEASDMPRSQRKRLKDAGLTNPAKGRGFMLTSTGAEAAKS